MGRSKEEAEYEKLLGRLSHDEPHMGWQSVRDLPALTDSDLATVLRAEPDVLLDALDEQHVCLIADTLALPDYDVLDHALRAGGLICTVAREAVLKRVLRDLICFCGRMNAEGIQTHGCVSAADAACPAQGPL